MLCKPLQFIKFAGKALAQLAPDESLSLQAGNYPARRFGGETEYRRHVLSGWRMA